MIKRLPILFIIFSLQLTFVCKASEDTTLSFRQIPYPSGRMLFDTYQDSRGYTWIASANGAARYNGARFIHYSKKDGLSDLNIFSFHEDSRQRIWAATFNGAPCFFHNGKWFNKENAPWLQPIAGNGPIQNILEHAGQVVVVCSRKIFWIRGDNIVRSIAVEKLQPYARKMAGAILFNGKLVLVTDAGFYLPAEKRFITLPATIRFLNQNTKMAVWNGKLCISQDREVYFFNASLQLETQLSTPGNQLVVNILPGKGIKAGPEQGILVVCTENGVYGLSAMGKAGMKLLADDVPWTSSFRKDRTGNVWATSLTRGLFLAERHAFRKIQLEGCAPEDICSRLEVINGQLWAGTEEGCVFREEEGSTSRLRFIHQARFSESLKRVRAFHAHHNRVYAALDGALLVTDTTTKATVRVPGATKAIRILKDDSLLIARSAKLVKVPAPDPTLSVQPPGGYPERTILEEKVLCMVPSGNDSTWIGCWEGIRLLFKDGALPIPAALKSIRSPVTAIVTMPENQLLIGTREEGLIHFDGRIIKHLHNGERDGYWVHQLLPADSPGQWWVASNAGLSAAVYKEGRFILEKSYGIPYEGPLLSIASHKGALWLATENGVYTLPLQKKAAPGPKVFWEEMALEDSVYMLQYSNTIPRLAHFQNNITLRFTPLYFSIVHAPVFRFKITPGNNQWETTVRPEIQFRQLAPGTYDIAVQARTPDSAFGPSAILHLYIAPPWWGTWWFRVLVGIAALGLMVLFFKTKMNRLRKKNAAAQQQIVQEKERVALQHQLLQWQQEAEKAQLTPHFVFNAIYALQGYYGAGKITEGKTYAEKFSGLIREQLRLSGKERISLEEEVRLLQNYCAWRNMKKRHPVEIHFEYKAPGAAHLSIPTMLLQPLIENCFDHGFEEDAPGQQIHVHINPDRSKAMINIEITDNGKGYTYTKHSGMEEAQYNTKEGSNGKGVALVGKRLELLGALAWGNRKPTCPLFEIDRMDERGGCRVVLKIPCSFEAHESV